MVTKNSVDNSVPTETSKTKIGKFEIVITCIWEGVFTVYVNTPRGLKYTSNYCHEVTAEEVLEAFQDRKSRKYFRLI